MKLDMKKPISWAIVVVGVVWLIVQLYTVLYRPLPMLILKATHLYCALCILFLYNPLAAKYGKKWLWAIDALLHASIAYGMYYIISEFGRLEIRATSIAPMLPQDTLAAVLTCLLILEAVRRCVSVNLLIVIFAFFAYAAFGRYIPGPLRYSGMTFRLFTEMLLLSGDGIMGAPLTSSVDTLFYFLLFGAFFTQCGAGQVLIDLGMKLSDKTTGGPAKAAMVSSSLVGMINGSAVANVSATGVFTIPLMKKAGYTPEQAGAIEAFSSSGGQIMPPIMGVGAFIMAELIGVPYVKIAVSAILPAIGYYLSGIVLVDFIARRKRLKTIGDKVLLYKSPPILPRLYLLLPMLLIVYMITKGASLATTALYGVLASIIICMFSREHRLTPRRLLGCINEGIESVARVAIPTAACGIIIGIVSRSGTAIKLAAVIKSAGEGNLVIALVIAMFGCLILGMGLPTVAAYIMANVLFCPTLISLGISRLAANMFVFYFGVFAQVTPPVCLAAFAAAGIAGASQWKTGWLAFGYSLVAFLMPYVFVFRGEMLMQGTWQDTVVTFGIQAFGIVMLAAAISGYLFVSLEKTWVRALLAIVSIMIIIPETLSTVVGLALAIFFCVFFFLKARKDRRVPSAVAPTGTCSN